MYLFRLVIFPTSVRQWSSNDTFINFSPLSHIEVELAFSQSVLQGARWEEVNLGEQDVGVHLWDSDGYWALDHYRRKWPCDFDLPTCRTMHQILPNFGVRGNRVWLPWATMNPSRIGWLDRAAGFRQVEEEYRRTLLLMQTCWIHGKYPHMYYSSTLVAVKSFHD